MTEGQDHKPGRWYHFDNRRPPKNTRILISNGTRWDLAGTCENDWIDRAYYQGSRGGYHWWMMPSLPRAAEQADT